MVFHCHVGFPVRLPEARPISPSLGAPYCGLQQSEHPTESRGNGGSPASLAENHLIIMGESWDNRGDLMGFYGG